MPVVIHVGFPKTATTALQRHVFPALAECAAATPADPLFRTLSTNLWVAPDDEFLEDTFRGYVDDLSRRSRTVVLSREDWSRNREQWTGQPTGDRSADRLARIAPGAQILVVVRNQPSMMRSMYGQYLRTGGGERMEGWAESVLDRSMLHFDQLVTRYHERFGRDAVKVMLYEHFVADPAQFLEEMVAFVDPGAPTTAITPPPRENAALGPLARRAYRVTNHHLRRVEHNPTPYDKGWSRVRTLQRAVVRVESRLPGRLLPAPTADERCVPDRYAAEFAASNTSLARLTGLPLETLNYPVGH